MKSYSYYTHIVAREALSYPIETHFNAFTIIVKQFNISDVIVTKNTITANQEVFNQLLINMVDCIHKN